MSQVTFYNANYRNKTYTGANLELVQDYTLWNGDRRRVGTAGPGYLKVREDGRTFKVTVPGKEQGYTVYSDAEPAEIVALRMEVEVLRAYLATQTGRDRDATRKRLARRVAKLEAMTA